MTRVTDTPTISAARSREIVMVTLSDIWFTRRSHYLLSGHRPERTPRWLVAAPRSVLRGIERALPPRAHRGSMALQETEDPARGDGRPARLAFLPGCAERVAR